MGRPVVGRGSFVSAVACPAAVGVDPTEQLQIIPDGDDLGAMVAGTMTTVVDLVGATSAALFLPDGARSELVECSHHPPRAACISKRRIPLDRFVADFLLRAGPTILPTENAAGHCLGSLLPSSSTDVFVAVPVRLDNGLAGVFLLGFERPLPPDLVHDRCFGPFLEQAAHVIGRYCASRRLQRGSANLSTLAVFEEALTLAADFHSALGYIIERVRQMLGAEAGGLYLHDVETDELILQWPAFGLSQEVVRRSRIPMSAGGIGVKVFRSGEVYLCHDLTSDPVVLHHFRLLHQAGSSIAVPVDVNNQRIGVFVVINKRRGRFTDKDVRLLSLLCTHLAVIIHNARLLESERQAVARLQNLNRVIEQQREGLRRTLEIHDELTRMVLDDRGMAAITATIGQLLGNPVAVADRFGTLVSHYPAEDHPELGEDWRRAIAGGITLPGACGEPIKFVSCASPAQIRRPTRLPPDPSLGLNVPRVLTPIFVGPEQLGCVCVLESRRSLDELDLQALERGALALALHMMREKATAEAQYRLRSDLVADLLSGSYGSGDTMLRRAAYLGIDLKVPRRVVVIDLDDPQCFASNGQPTEKAATLRSRLVEVVERACRWAKRDAVVSAMTDEVIILASIPGAASASGNADPQRLGDALQAEIRRWIPEITVSVGLGGKCETPFDYGHSYRQARYVLDLIKASHQRNRTLAFDQLGVCGLLVAPHKGDELFRLVQTTLGGLLEWDRCHSSDLTRTLERFLLDDCQLERAASSLHIHPNTLRYRLRRIAQITGADLGSFEARFNLRLALQVWCVVNVSQNPTQGHRDCATGTVQPMEHHIARSISQDRLSGKLRHLN